MTPLSLGQSAREAIEVFRCFEDGAPDLVPTGMGAVDRVLGGLFPGSAGILAAATGVGKSSIILSSALTNPAHVGIISTEDTPDVLGSRALAYESGVDSLRIRTKAFSEVEREKLRDAECTLQGRSNVHVAYCVGSPLDEIVDAIHSLAKAGCRLIWLDYIQKVRGVREDRRNEVAGVFTTAQRECSRAGAALMAVSQFARQADPTRPPQIWWLKESGDLENEARLILLASRDNVEPNRLNVCVAKSTFGGEGLAFSYVRDASGTLREETSASYAGAVF